MMHKVACDRCLLLECALRDVSRSAKQKTCSIKRARVTDSEIACPEKRVETTYKSAAGPVRTTLARSGIQIVGSLLSWQNSGIGN